MDRKPEGFLVINIINKIISIKEYKNLFDDSFYLPNVLVLKGYNFGGLIK